MVFLPHWPKRTKLSEQIILGTDRVQSALDHLDNPEARLPRVIHVTGTNGKGSTVSYIARILQVAGYAVHTFTSPHLVDFNERIVLDGHKISDDHLFRVMEECRMVVERHSILLTLFEATTVAAFLAFASVPADFLILEVGMGGRSDATNVIRKPFLSIITSISYDHEEFLGNTLPSIAFEKAGIIKNSCPCVVGKQSSNEVSVLLDAYAKNMNSPSMICGVDWSCERDNTKDLLIFESESMSVELPIPALRGAHQVHNAGNAIASFALMRKIHNFHVSMDDIGKGLSSTYWPARLELITSRIIRGMLPGAWEAYLDGAHNTSGAIALAQWAFENRDAPVYLILGMTKGKNVAEFLETLKPHIKFVCGVCVQRELNSQRGEVISQHAEAAGIATQSFSYLPRALEYIAETEKETPMVRILICGSLYLASDIKRLEQGILI